MQILLNDIELDVQELKCLLQAVESGGGTALKSVAKRSIRQMQERLENLSQMLDRLEETQTGEEPVPEVVSGPQHQADEGRFDVGGAVRQAEEAAPAILADRIRPIADLRHAISLNDSFRFTRELFAGNAALMNETVARIACVGSLEQATALLQASASWDEENEAAADFMELLKKYFS